jgi:hypothetical protein
MHSILVFPAEVPAPLKTVVMAELPLSKEHPTSLFCPEPAELAAIAWPVAPNLKVQEMKSTETDRAVALLILMSAPAFVDPCRKAQLSNVIFRVDVVEPPIFIRAAALFAAAVEKVTP